MSELLVPEFVNGKPTFVPYAGDIPKLLKEGDPTMGWVGDDRLYMINLGDGRWAVGRLCEDGTRQLVLTGTGRVDKQILARLRDHDTRHVDVLKNMRKNNEKAEAEQNAKSYDRIGSSYEKLIWAIGRDVG